MHACGRREAEAAKAEAAAASAEAARLEAGLREVRCRSFECTASLTCLITPFQARLHVEYVFSSACRMPYYLD